MLCVVLLSQIGFAQDIDRAKLDRYFDTLEAHEKVMGSVALSKNNKIIYTRSIGYADVENAIKNTENTKYRIGSISKTFTAVLVFKAVEAGKIKLNQTIDAYFSSIPNADRITIRQLLNHRSGIYNFTSDSDYLTWNTQAKTEEEMVSLIADFGSDFEPDSTAEYSNSNFVLLTYILEKSFKSSYADLIQKHIAKPLGLKNTYFGAGINTENKESKSYRFTSKWELESESDLSIPLGAGGMVSTSTDLIKFGEALFSNTLISKEHVTEMKTITDGFGMGLLQFPFGEKKVFGHSGGIDGFVSMWGYFPEDNISFAMTSNGNHMNANDVTLTLLNAVFNKPYDIPDFKVFEVDLADLESYEGIYSSTQIPIEITVSIVNGVLMGQATGQSQFPLEAKEQHVFEFELAGLVLEFNPTEKSMILKQGGGEFSFVKE